MSKKKMSRQIHINCVEMPYFLWLPRHFILLLLRCFICLPYMISFTSPQPLQIGNVLRLSQPLFSSYSHSYGNFTLTLVLHIICIMIICNYTSPVWNSPLNSRLMYPPDYTVNNSNWTNRNGASNRPPPNLFLLNHPYLR